MPEYADNYISRSEQLHPVPPDLSPSISHNHRYVVTSNLVAAVSPVSPSFPNFPPPLCAPFGGRREQKRGGIAARPPLFEAIGRKFVAQAQVQVLVG